MKATKQTLNKDGSLRKKGSGRRKGSNSFVKISFSQLKDYIGEKTPMVVSRVWLEDLGLLMAQKQEEVSLSLPLTEEDKSDSIQFTVKNFDEE